VPDEDSRRAAERTDVPEGSPGPPSTGPRRGADRGAAGLRTGGGRCGLGSYRVEPVMWSTVYGSGDPGVAVEATRCSEKLRGAVASGAGMVPRLELRAMRDLSRPNDSSRSDESSGEPSGQETGEQEVSGKPGEFPLLKLESGELDDSGGDLESGESGELDDDDGSGSDDGPDLSGRRLGNYVLRQRIGGGGNGVVYRAEHLVLRRGAAVKVMTKEQACRDRAEARFLREAQLAAKLRHDNAAHVYDFGVAEEDGLMWLAMEFVDGHNFATWLETHGPMSFAEAMEFFDQVFAAVDAAHQCGIVHRDLKPSNVMVVEGKGLLEGKLIAKLIDFGIAKGLPAAIIEDEAPIVEPVGDDVATDLVRRERAPGYRKPTTRYPLALLMKHIIKAHERRLTPQGFCGFGSRGYMAPEQRWKASSVEASADIYSLGIMFCEAITGRLPLLPLKKEESADLTTTEFEVQIQPVEGIQLSAALERVLYRALAKDPKERHANVLELARELRAVLQADPNVKIRSLTRHWHEQGRSSELLARGRVLLELKRSVQSPSVAARLTKMDNSFIALSLQRATHARWAIGVIVALVGLSVLAVSGEVRRRTADRAATELEVERGQQALLHGEPSEAVRHLGQAYEHGARSPEVAFMLARALQPRMSELARFVSSSGRMWSAMFSPDDKRVLTTDDQGAQMWDAVSGQLLFTMSHGATVYRAVFDEDGARIFTAGGDGTVRIWNAATGTLIRELAYRGQEAKRLSYSMVAVSSHLVAAIDMMGQSAHVWDGEKGTLLAKLGELADDASEKAALAFSPDGRWLVASGGDDVRIFDTMTWRRVGAIPGPRVRSLTFDPTGSRLAVGTYDGVASIWEIPSGVRVRRLRDGGASVDAITFSRDGALVETASRDGTEQVWDVASGGLRTQFNAHHDKIYAVEFSRNGDRVLSAGADGAVVISMVGTGMPVARLEGPKKLVIAAHFDAEARRVVGASWDGAARVWDAASPHRRWSSPQVGAECDSEESLVPDQRFVALSCRAHGTHVWDTARGELLAVLPAVTRVGGDYFSALPAVTGNGDRAAIARSNVVEVYALPSGHLLRTIVHSAAVNGIGFAPAGHDLISGAIDGSLWITHGDNEPIALSPSSAGIDAVAILADGRVVVADAGRRLRVMGRDGSTLMDVSTPTRIRLLRATADGSRLVTISTTSEQAAPLLWDLDRYQLVMRLEGHAGRVFTARFAEVGGRRELLTTGADGTVRLWDAATGQPRRSFRGDSHFLVDAALAPDGAVIVAGGSDGFLRFWDSSSERLLWMMQAHTSYVVGVHYEGNELVTRGFAGDVARWGIPSPYEIIEACRASACVSEQPVGK